MREKEAIGEFNSSGGAVQKRSNWLRHLSLAGCGGENFVNNMT
jgi:hypothetical protein